MSDEVECLCLMCGMSHYLAPDLLVFEGPEEFTRKMVTNVYCSVCGGELMTIGKAGDEPFYRTDY